MRPSQTFCQCLCGGVTEKLDPRTKALSEEIGTTLKEARLKAGLSQTKLADLAGMTRNNYVRIEKGQTNVTIDSLLRVADGLGLELKVDLRGPSK